MDLRSIPEMQRESTKIIGDLAKSQIERRQVRVVNSG